LPAPQPPRRGHLHSEEVGIVAVSQPAWLVTMQMLLDLLALGLVVRASVGAVQFAMQQAPGPTARGRRASRY
jgi:hypothetical protein